MIIHISLASIYISSLFATTQTFGLRLFSTDHYATGWVGLISECYPTGFKCFLNSEIRFIAYTELSLPQYSPTL